MSPNSYTPNAAIFAAAQGLATPQEQATALVLTSSRPCDGETIRRLFKQEAVKVGRLLGINPLLDPSDALGALRDGIGATVIHIASHGHFDPSAPSQSGLSLRHRGREQVLPIDTLYDMPLSADLVFLSGCDTGRVNVQKNDEPVGLLAPLLGGKARSAILSFWPIVGGIDLTVELVTGFYRHWRVDGISRAEALRRTMLDHCGNPNPYLWGGYGLYGAVSR